MVTGLVNDASSVVAEAARTTVEKVCHTIDNRDIEPFIDDMVAATIDHDKTDECVQSWRRRRSCKPLLRRRWR